MTNTFSNILIIGATQKNLGKTSLVCEILEKFSKSEDIIAVKCITYHNDDSIFHGKSCGLKPQIVEIKEEAEANNDTDTARMCQAGAKHAFIIKSNESELEAAFLNLYAQFPDKLWICESNSLRKYIKPAKFVMLTDNIGTSAKPSATDVIEVADTILSSKQKQIQFTENLSVQNKQWIFNNNKK